MRREGRQHGLVMTVDPAGCFQHTRPGLVVDASDSPPTTAFRTRVPVKPTNHSKYTGRSPGRYRHNHHHAASKSRDKSKGSRKLRGLDIGLNPRLASWRVVAGAAGDGWTFAAGGSASAAAVYLSGYLLEEDEEGPRWGRLGVEPKWVDDDVEEEETEQMEEAEGGEMEPREGDEGEEEGGGEVEQEGLEEDGVGGDGDEDGDDDDVDFCEVWAVWDYVDEEDWCVVGEMET